MGEKPRDEQRGGVVLEMTAGREALPPPPPAPSQSGIVDRVPGPVVVLLWSSLVVGGYLAAGLKGLVFTGPILIVLLPARWRAIVDRVAGPVVVLLWSSLVVGGYLWAGLKGLVFTGAIALVVAGMVAVPRRWRPKEPPKTWFGIFLPCWAVWMYSSNGEEWVLLFPAVWALATLTAWRYWPPKPAGSRLAAAESRSWV